MTVQSVPAANAVTERVTHSSVTFLAFCSLLVQPGGRGMPAPLRDSAARGRSPSSCLSRCLQPAPAPFLHAPLLPAAYSYLLAAHCPMPTTYCPLPAAQSCLLTARGLLLPPTHCLLPILLPTACCPLLVAHADACSYLSNAPCFLHCSLLTLLLTICCPWPLLLPAPLMLCELRTIPRQVQH